MQKSLILSSLMALAFSADAAMFEFACDKADGVYALGEKATITVTVFKTNSVPLETGKVKWRLNNFGDATIEDGTFDLSKGTNTFSVSGAMKEPGFMRLDVSELTAKGHARGMVCSRR